MDTETKTVGAHETDGSRELDKWLSEDGAPSVAEFARAIDVSRAAVVAFRRGEYRPKDPERRKIARYSKNRIRVEMWLTHEESAEIAAVKPHVKAAS